LAPNLPIVGIGASAGGVEALEQFFKAVPADKVWRLSL
jgi:chemotaxis response regulator CheB